MKTIITTTVRTKSQFVQTAGRLSAIVGSTSLDANARTFSDGKGHAGWYFNGKIDATVGESLTLCVNGMPIELDWTRFGSGSYGWKMAGADRMETEILAEDGNVYPVSIRGNFTVIHSSSWTDVPMGQTDKVQVGMFVEVLNSKKWAA